ncbi:hypothetical protein JCM6882_004790 [Rhodosporidiobolus microsporus]
MNLPDAETAYQDGLKRLKASARELSASPPPHVYVHQTAVVGDPAFGLNLLLDGPPPLWIQADAALRKAWAFPCAETLAVGKYGVELAVAVIERAEKTRNKEWKAATEWLPSSSLAAPTPSSPSSPSRSRAAPATPPRRSSSRSYPTPASSAPRIPLFKHSSNEPTTPTARARGKAKEELSDDGWEPESPPKKTKKAARSSGPKLRGVASSIATPSRAAFPKDDAFTGNAVASSSRSRYVFSPTPKKEHFSPTPDPVPYLDREGAVSPSPPPSPEIKALSDDDDDDDDDDYAPPSPPVYRSPFDPASHNLISLEPHKNVLPFLDTLYSRSIPHKFQKMQYLHWTTPFKIQHYDLGPGSFSTTAGVYGWLNPQGHQLFLHPSTFDLPAKAGDPVMLLLTAQESNEIRKVVKRAPNEALSVFGGEQSGRSMLWRYFGEMAEEKTEQEVLLGGDAGFLSLSEDEQDQWAELVLKKLNTSSTRSDDAKLWRLALDDAGDLTIDNVHQALSAEGVKIQYRFWTCREFDQKKLAAWEANVERKERWMRFLAGASLPTDNDADLRMACQDAHAAAASGAKPPRSAPKGKSPKKPPPGVMSLMSYFE